MALLTKATQEVDSKISRSRKKVFLKRKELKGLKQPFAALNTLGGSQYQIASDLENLKCDKDEFPYYINFFRTKDGEQGALVFTLRDSRPLIYCENAILGYDGSGPRISNMLLEFLEVDPMWLDTLQEELWGQSEYDITLRVFRVHL